MAKMNKTTIIEPMKRLTSSSGFKSFTASLVSIFIGLLIGFLIMLFSSFSISGAEPFMGLAYLFAGPFTAYDIPNDFGNMIFYTVPLIFTSLSVAVAYKTGLFNIGAPGQFLMGTMMALLIALNINSTGNAVQGVFVWILAIICAAVAGLVWGLIPGCLKAFFGINEVIVSIMSNWIAANLFTWVFSSDAMSHLVNTGAGKSGYLITTTVTGNSTPDWGLGSLTNNSYLDIGIFIAIIIAVLCWLLLNKTTIGYSMKACGANKFSAKYAGINDKFNIMLAMAIAGALAGLGGAFYYLHAGIEIQFKSVYQILPDYGFSGIAGAFLANCNPIACIFSALFIRYINASGTNLVSVGYNRYFADIIIAVIIYLAGFTTFFQNVIWRLFKKKKIKKAVETPPIEKGGPDKMPEDIDVKKEENK
jgi:general nucleoside transport system permease protein